MVIFIWNYCRYKPALALTAVKKTKIREINTDNNKSHILISFNAYTKSYIILHTPAHDTIIFLHLTDYLLKDPCGRVDTFLVSITTSVGNLCEKHGSTLSQQPPSSPGSILDIYHHFHPTVLGLQPVIYSTSAMLTAEACTLLNLWQQFGKYYSKNV